VVAYASETKKGSPGKAKKIETPDREIHIYLGARGMNIQRGWFFSITTIMALITMNLTDLCRADDKARDPPGNSVGGRKSSFSQGGLAGGT
jgi:hypothetical protein